MIVYVHTSAAMKLVVQETESDALAAALQRLRRRATLVSSFLLSTELQCAAARRSEEMPGAAVAAVLAVVELIDVERADVLVAPTLPGRLRSADAIHLACALRVEADQLVGYDAELNAAAAASGLTVVTPGSS